MKSQALIRGKMRPVKNLGWLLDHWVQVSYFKVLKPESKGENFLPDALLQAYDVNDTLIYETEYGSKDMLWDFLDRPKFRGAKVDWFGEKTICGAKDGMIKVDPKMILHNLQRG